MKDDEEEEDKPKILEKFRAHWRKVLQNFQFFKKQTYVLRALPPHDTINICVVTTVAAVSSEEFLVLRQSRLVERVLVG